ncbi:Replication factor-A carboxy-terminal domain protein [Arachis hypogaea]|nr:Replication factor-A carboxy-terminal domain protein [Arachis hypogaea]
MLPLFDSISKIYLLKEAWRLKVRVLRTWIVPSFGNHNVANSIEIVLVDEDSNKIQATVKKQLINRAAEHEFKLVFLNRTTVIPVPNDAIPKTCFKFCPFDELLKMTEDCVYLVDIIGLLTFAGEEKEYVKDGKVMKMIVLELSSKELTIRYALFGEYVDEVHRFLDTKSVGADKYFRTFRVRIVCDDATIIAMFELPNYDADAERTPVKDGYLEKIPSSDHEYIVDKKDPCEVLDEGITSDGNCSNMKTNCKPLIDFLDENGAEVPGLDDIKIVYNLPRGGKVKKNLKKAFDDVADEELGPTSKVLKNRDL